MGTAPNPTSALVGQKLTAAFWNTEVATAITFLANPPTIMLRCTTGDTWSGAAHVTGPTSIANAATTNFVWFDAEDRDADNTHSTVTRADQITIATSGIYAINVQLFFAASAAGNRYATINVNTAATMTPFIMSGYTSNTNTYGAFCHLILNAGDVVQVVPIQNSGGALNFSGGRLTMVWCGK